MPREVMTLRIEPGLRRRLASAARRRRRTESELARWAVEAWLDAEEGVERSAPYAAVEDLIGCVRSSAPAPAPTRQRAAARKKK